jgi:small subunit ribosomal protein S9
MALKKKAAQVQKIVKKTATPAQSSGHKGNRGDYIATVGRRKTAIARVRLYRGSGDAQVNGKAFETFFDSSIDRNVVCAPLFVTGTDKSVYFTAKVVGGGTKGQAQAISHGISRALVKLSEEHKTLLRKKGLITRDPRMRETRKIGTGGKARRAKQSPKR